eukprot:6210891-Pleurochrysis_carterae.AAC.1
MRHAKKGRHDGQQGVGKGEGGVRVLCCAAALRLYLNPNALKAGEVAAWRETEVGGRWREQARPGMAKTYVASFGPKTRPKTRCHFALFMLLTNRWPRRGTPRKCAASLITRVSERCSRMLTAGAGISDLSLYQFVLD